MTSKNPAKKIGGRGYQLIQWQNSDGLGKREDNLTSCSMVDKHSVIELVCMGLRGLTQVEDCQGQYPCNAHFDCPSCSWTRPESGTKSP